MRELQRLTTEYIDAEDRIRLTGEVGTDESVILWLSQRLLLRLLPHLFLWLEKQNGNALPVEIMQSLEQAAANENLTAESPVQRHGNSHNWLVEAVDLTPEQQLLRLSFRRDGEAAVSLSLTSLQLRQWLGILHSLWGLAEWPQAIWPEWMRESVRKSDTKGQVRLH